MFTVSLKLSLFFISSSSVSLSFASGSISPAALYRLSWLPERLELKTINQNQQLGKSYLCIYMLFAILINNSRRIKRQNKNECLISSCISNTKFYWFTQTFRSIFSPKLTSLMTQSTFHFSQIAPSHLQDKSPVDLILHQKDISLYLSRNFVTSSWIPRIEFCSRCILITVDKMSNVWVTFEGWPSEVSWNKCGTSC